MLHCMTGQQFNGVLLCAHRKHLRMTLEELSRLATLPYPFLVSLECNQARPSIRALERLCEALSCNPDTFFTATDGDDTDLRPTELGRDADEWIARTLATAPPLTERQAKVISAALFGQQPG
jgi:transcriptional regulator with XRE-family HTH domain